MVLVYFVFPMYAPNLSHIRKFIESNETDTICTFLRVIFTDAYFIFEMTNVRQKCRYICFSANFCLLRLFFAQINVFFYEGRYKFPHSRNLWFVNSSAKRPVDPTRSLWLVRTKKIVGKRVLNIYEDWASYICVSGGQVCLSLGSEFSKFVLRA